MPSWRSPAGLIVVISNGPRMIGVGEPGASVTTCVAGPAFAAGSSRCVTGAAVVVLVAGAPPPCLQAMTTMKTSLCTPPRYRPRAAEPTRAMLASR